MDQIKTDMYEVFVQVNVPHSNVIKATPLNDKFSKDVYAFIRKIKLRRFKNNFISGLKHEITTVIRNVTTYLILIWKKIKK